MTWIIRNEIARNYAIGSDGDFVAYQYSDRLHNLRIITDCKPGILSCCQGGKRDPVIKEYIIAYVYLQIAIDKRQSLPGVLDVQPPPALRAPASKERLVI